MATFNSDLVGKRIRHRGLYSGKEQSVSARYRVAPGASIATTDRIRMIPVGENVRPIRITTLMKVVSGTPTPTNPSFSVGVDPELATSLARPDGTTYPPLTLSATRLGASQALTTDEMNQYTEVDTPADAANWGPYYITLVPSGAGAFSVAGGTVDLILEAVFLGEQSIVEPIYTEFMNQKYKN